MDSVSPLHPNFSHFSLDFNSRIMVRAKMIFNKSGGTRNMDIKRRSDCHV
jgi:hypothetical protein